MKNKSLLRKIIGRLLLVFVFTFCSAMALQGQSWTLQTSGTAQSLYGIYFIDANNGWVVGQGGTIRRTTNGGSTWTAQTSGITGPLYDVVFLDANNGWAVGDVGRVLKTTNGGVNWTILGAPFNSTNQGFYGIHFTSASVGYIAGYDYTTVPNAAVIFKTTDGGSSWVVNYATSVDYLVDIHFGDINTGYALPEAVDGGKFLKTTNSGTSWTLSTFSTNTQHVGQSVFFTDANTGWIAGINYTGSLGLVYKTTNGGSSWVNQLSGSIPGFLSIRFFDANIGWVVGNDGAIYYTSNGGTNWTLQPSGITGSSINDISIFNATTAWVCGDLGKISKYACTPSSITLGVSPTVCRGTVSASLPYTATTGTPDTYSIDYDAAANTAGFVDVVNAALPVSPITLTVPGTAPAATYNGTITVIKAAGGCVSPAVPFTVSVNDVTGGTVVADQTICSGGDPALFTQTVASTGTGTLSYQWQSSTTSCAAGFSNIGGATAITYDAPAGLLVTTYYRRVTTSTLNAVACTANSNCITLTVNNVTGGTVAADQTICSGGDPAAFTQTVASTGTALTYQWQSSTTSCAAGFSDIGGATSTTYDAPSGLAITTYYRRVTTSTLNAVACTANSNCITVTVNSVTGGTVGSDQSLTSPADPAAFTQSVASTGSGALTYQWQSSTTDCTTGFSNIGGATATTYDAPAGLLVTTYYRRVTTSTLNAVPCTANSNCITVTVSTCSLTLTSAPGTNNQTVCNNTAITNITYSNTAGQGATGATVTGLPTGVTGAWVLDVVTISGTPSVGGTYNYTVTLAGGTCAGVTANGTIYVNDVTAGTVAADQTICSGGDPALFTQTVASTGTGALTYQWQSSTTSCAAGFSNIGGATATTYDAPASLLVTTYYRRVTTSTLNAVACTANSNCITVTVNNVTGGTVAADQTICSGGDPALFTETVASTGTGALTYQWQSSTTSCAASFSNIGGATATTYDAPAGLALTTFYRRVTTSTVNGVPCTANSNCITVTINSVAGGTIGSDQSQCSPADPAIIVHLVASTGSGALTYQWQSSTTDCVSGFSNIGGATAISYDPPAGLTQTTYYRRVTTSTLSGVPCTDNSNCVTKTINPNNTITLTSAPATNNQTVLINTPITNITYSTTGATGATFSGLPAGVTGNWAANTVTISGSPSVQGTFNYMVTLTGGCGNVTATGTINVISCSVTLTSATGTNAQTVCINTPITNITYATISATGATFIGLPVGVNGAWAANVVTISGTPSVAGVFNYTVTLTGGLCGGITANGTISSNDVTGGTVAADQTICTGGDPAAFIVTVASTGSGALSYQWQSSTTGCVSGFSNIAGATATTYDPPSGLTQTTYYRRVTTSTLNSVTCTANSNCVTIFVNDVTDGTVAVDQTICSGGDPAAFTQTVASTGSGTLTYQWQSSTTSCAAGFSNIAGATSTTYDAPAGLTLTTYYRRVTTSTLNAVVCIANSNCVTVTVNDVTSGTVAADQTICSGGDPAAFTQTVASTGSGTLTYQWQSSTTSCAAGFSNIAGATATTYDAPAGLTVTTYYRRVTTSTLNAVACTANSNCITVTLKTISVAPTGITGITTICTGGSTTLTVTGGSLGTGAIVEWFTGSCGGTTAGTGNTITVSPTVSTTYFVRYSSTCNTTTCASVTVVVNTPSVGGTVAPAQNQGCGPQTVNLTVSGITGTVTRWERQTNCNGAWASIGNAGLTTITVTTPNSSTCYRAVVTNGVCPSANSTVSTITVDKPAVGGRVTLQSNQTATSIALCPSQNALLIPLGFTGKVATWQYSFGTSSIWYDLPGTAGQTTLTVNGSTISGTVFYRVVIVTELGICTSQSSVAYSTAFRITKKAGCLSPDGSDIISDKGFTVVKAYPNPASHLITLEIENYTEGVAQLDLLDVTGRQIMKQTVNLTEGMNTISLDISQLSSGIFIVKMTDSQNQKTWVKMVKE